MAMLSFLAGIGACGLIVLYGLLAYLSPLSRIPNAHWSVGIFPGWILWARFCGRESAEVRKAHDRLGPLVRLGPSEVSVNFVHGGIKTVYGSFEKHKWYRSFWNLGQPNMFSFEDFALHSERRRALSRIYSKSHLFHSRPLRLQNEAILYGRLAGVLEKHARDGVPLEAFGTMLSVTMDIVTAFFFGLSHSSNFLEDEEQHQLRLKQYQSRAPYAFYTQEIQSLWGLLERSGFDVIPSGVRSDVDGFEQWIAGMCDRSARRVREKSPGEAGVDDGTVVQELHKAMSSRGTEEKGAAQKALSIASEMTDHAIAGHETSAVALTYLIYELSQEPSLQAKLREEVAPLYRHAAPRKELPDFAAIDQLPFLQACVLEILRLYPPIMGAQARVTPKGGAVLGDVHVPGGIRVSARASCLHYNGEVYPEPYKFRPSRWLNVDGNVKKASEAPEMYHWWWAFGSGGRVCLGNHFALHDIKIVASFLYASYRTEYVGSDGLVQTDGYIGAPVGGNLLVSLRAGAAAGSAGRK